MQGSWLAVAFAAALVVGCGSRPNPNLCCVDPTDCANEGIPVGTTCADGLVCRGNQCIAETCTTTAECDQALPYCVSGGLCSAMCADNSQCPGFGQDASDKVCSMGACVECGSANDCTASSPICDMNKCRGCELDAECSSGACGQDGSCIAESSIVYIDTRGVDAGSCSRSSPCKTLQFGVGVANPTRSHIVLAKGTYVGSTTINTMSTTAAAIEIHGGGASLQPTPADDLPTITVYDVAGTLHDLDFPGNGAFAAAVQSGASECQVSRVTLENTGGFIVGANMAIHDAVIKDSITFSAIDLTSMSHLELDRVEISGGMEGVNNSSTNVGAIVNFNNVLIHDTTSAALDIPAVTGSIAFTTVAGSGLSGSIPSAFICDLGLSVSSSIVWTPSGAPVVGACTLHSVIAGPIAVTGAQNTDPMFKDEAHRDYHLTTSSPAVDVVDTGPMTDLDGHTRPCGARFDLGAYELCP